MSNSVYMANNFESQKNIKASGYTAGICGALLVIFLFVKWTLPSIPPPPLEEGIEVNLGNSDLGSGNDQPHSPGKAAPNDAQQTYTPPKAAVAPSEPAKDIETDDKDEDAPAVVKAPVTKPDAKRVPEKEVVNKPVTKPAVESPPAPPVKKPKTVMGAVSGTGTGGNDADSYKKGTGEGIAGGRGDQGQPGGNPDSKNYTGGGRGNSGVSISRGLQGRRVVSTPSFEDDFNENAKVAVDIRVDASGRVTEANYQPRGSTTSDASMKEIARRKALQVKFNSGSVESTGTIVFNFKLKN